MPLVIGDAVILVGADASNFTSGLNKDISKKTPGIGSKITGLLGKSLKVGAVSVGTAVGGTLGTALFQGFKRLDQIDQAKAKLTGLGHSAGGVEKIMNNALASVKGTAFGMGEAASSAATLVAAGVKPGQDLTRTLSLMGDAATISGRGLADMGQVFNKVAAGGKVTGDTIAQLTDRGIPILQLLSKELGVTTAEAQDMASKGKISFDTFKDAIESGMGGAALKSGETFSGSLANVKASLGRLGAAILGPAFKVLPGIFEKAIGVIDKITPKVTVVAGVIGDKLGGAIKSISKIKLPDINFGKIADSIKKGLNSDLIKDFASSAQSLFGSLVKSAQTLAPVLLKVGKALAPIVGGVIVVGIKVLTVAFKVLGPIIEIVSKALAVLFTILTNPVVLTAIKAIGAALLVMLLPFLGPVALVVAAITAFVLALDVIKTVVASVVAFVTANWQLLVAIIAGPLGIIILLVVKNFDKIKEVVTTVLTAVGDFIAGVWEWISSTAKDALNKVLDIIVGAWNAVGEKTRAAFDKVKSMVSSAFNSIKSTVTSGISTIVSLITGLPGKISAIAGKFLSAGKDLGKSVIDGLQNGLAKTGSFLADIGNSVRRKINSVLHLPFTIGKGPLKFTIPAFAKGTNFAPGGISLVGEKGPELVNLPRGSKVTPNHKLPTGGGSTTNYITIELSMDDLSQLKDLEDLLALLEKARVTTRKTQRSGTVTS